jgi:hypothetical protein
MDCIKVLPCVCDYQKEDSTFIPIKDDNTSRWHVNANGRDYELLITGAKWFDTRKQKGGGGAIDLAMHLFDLDFVNAVKLLKKKIK